MKKQLLAGLLGTCALVCFWLFQRGEEPNSAGGAPIEGSNDPPAKLRNENFPTADERELLKAQTASSDLPTAYQVLAHSTSLPAESVDPTGRTLPSEFAAYLEDENRGYDQFVASLSADGAAAFNVLKQSAGILGADQFIEFVAKNGASDKPSTFDFVLYTSLRELAREYPANNDVAKVNIAQHWSLLAQSSNPIFRLLAINEVNSVIKDKGGALAVLDERTSETDPVIVQALIDQFAVIGGDDAKAALTQISNNARARRDQALSKAADDARAKLK